MVQDRALELSVDRRMREMNDHEAAKPGFRYARAPCPFSCVSAHPGSSLASASSVHFRSLRPTDRQNLGHQVPPLVSVDRNERAD